MGHLTEYVKMALKNIQSSKGRSFLTMLGIIIGIFSVILIISIGDGVKSDLSDELNSFAGGQVYLYSSNNSLEEADISAEDMEALADIDHVSGVTPYESYQGELKTTKGEFDMSANFGSESMRYVANEDMLSGRYLSASDVEAGALVAVISDSDALKMFGSTDVVGLSVDVSIQGVSRELTIVGVKKAGENGTFVTYVYEDSPVEFEIPYTAMSQFGLESDSFYAVYLIADSSTFASAVAQGALDTMNSRKNIDVEEDLYAVQDIASQLDSITSMLDMVTLFITLVAAISLLVGGIGVMNIMLVSVTERTREIGIRKALGAKTGYITMQFLAEAAIITLIGGIIGILLGVGAARLVTVATGGLVNSRISVSTVLIATLFSMGVGILFGVYPARRAAKLSPMEALRRN